MPRIFQIERQRRFARLSPVVIQAILRPLNSIHRDIVGERDRFPAAKIRTMLKQISNFGIFNRGTNDAEQWLRSNNGDDAIFVFATDLFQRMDDSISDFLDRFATWRTN